MLLEAIDSALAEKVVRWRVDEQREQEAEEQCLRGPAAGHAVGRRLDGGRRC